MSTSEPQTAPAFDVNEIATTHLEHESGQRSRRRFGPLSIFAFSWLALVVFAALFGGILPLRDPTVDVGVLNLGPFRRWSQPLGTDSLGRSLLSRVVEGARVSLAVGVFATVLGLVIGLTLGVIGGYSRLADRVISTVTDAMLAFPGLVFLLALATILKPSLSTLVLGLAVLSIPTFVRLSRANTLRFKDREFVLASRLLGARTPRTMLREIVPNVAPPVLVYAMIVMANLIVIEAAVSFLGLGIPPPRSSWGGMVADGQKVMTLHPWQVFCPAGMIVLTVFALHVIGDEIHTRVTGQHGGVG